eukprot:gene1087-6266_t
MLAHAGKRVVCLSAARRVADVELLGPGPPLALLSRADTALPRGGEWRVVD